MSIFRIRLQIIKKQINNMRTLFFFLVLTTALSLNAQITKGNWLVGGDGNYSSVKFLSEINGIKTKSTANSIRLNPNLGYFISDKFAGGLQLNFTFLEPGSSTKSTSYSFGPFIRYYFLEQSKRINLFAQANYNLGFGKNASNVETDTNGYGLKAGTVLFFNSSVGIELSLNYTNSNSKSNFNGGSENTSKTFLIGLGFQIHLEK
jgi:hypothetical protein